MSIHLSLTHSLVKVFPENAAAEPARSLSVLKNDQVSFQLLVRPDVNVYRHRGEYRILLDSPLKDYITVRRVETVPVRLAAFDASDGNYLSDRPGLYPDLLTPLYDGCLFHAVSGETTALWIEVRIPAEADAGVFPVHLTIECGEETASVTAEVTVLDAVLPPQELKHTEWFHCDGLAQFYQEEVWSDRFFELVRRQVRTAVSRGINMLLVPLWTPPLDTRIGGERLTTQLIDVFLTHGRYFFGFERLHRFLDLLDQEGIRYFEMSHLFTQWGARHCPKILADVDGTTRRIFGWESDATGEAYRSFLEAFLPALTRKLADWGYDKRTSFHISDEPSSESLPQYQACRRMVEPLLQGYPIMDAMSDYSYFEQGICQVPVVATNHLDPFLNGRRPEEFWVYYCCGQGHKVSNRFIAMPSARTRILGVQLYKFQVNGFLQWGFNFYNNVTSIHPIDPFMTTDGEQSYPAGDPFMVYPGPDGEPWESLRLVVFSDALCDLRALQLLESLTSREHVLALIEDGLEEPVTFSEYPHDAGYLLELREKINREIAKKTAESF